MKLPALYFKGFENIVEFKIISNISVCGIFVLTSWKVLRTYAVKRIAYA